MFYIESIFEVNLTSFYLFVNHEPAVGVQFVELCFLCISDFAFVLQSTVKFFIDFCESYSTSTNLFLLSDHCKISFILWFSFYLRDTKAVFRNELFHLF